MVSPSPAPALSQLFTSFMLGACLLGILWSHSVLKLTTEHGMTLIF